MSADIPKSEITPEQYNDQVDPKLTISLNKRLHKFADTIYQRLKQNKTTGGRTRKPRVKSHTRSKKRSKSKSKS